MSCLNSGRRRSASSGVSPVGWNFQNRPWWTSTSCAPSSTARSCSSRRALTPVTTWVTSCAPGTCRPLGPRSSNSVADRSSSSVVMMSVICAMGFESAEFGRSATYIVPLSPDQGPGGGERARIVRAGGTSTVGRGTSGAVAAPAYDGAGSPADSDQQLVARVRRGRRSRVRAPLPALSPAHPRLRARDGQGPRPRGGRDAGGLRLRAAPHARDRAAAGLQAVALPDRQEQLHRRVPALQAGRRGLLRRRRRAGAGRSLAAGRAAGRRPTPRSPPSRTSTTSAARSAGCPRPTTRSSSCASSRACPTRRSAAAWACRGPAVESTLFRARRRLTEEYDDIVSGARCQRIQGIIITAAQSRLGTRDTRRLARHLSHCQPCRREALAAGLDRGLFARPTRARARGDQGRRRAAVPDLLQVPPRRARTPSAAAPPSGRGAALMSHLPSSPSRAGARPPRAPPCSSRASGAGVGVHHQTTSSPPRRSRPPCARRRAAAKAAAPRRADSHAGRDPGGASTPAAEPIARPPPAASRRAGRRRRRAVDRATSAGGGPAAGAVPKSGGGAQQQTPAELGLGARAPARPAGSNPAPAREAAQVAALGGAVPPSTPAARPTPVKDAVQQTTDAVDDTVQQTTEAVQRDHARGHRARSTTPSGRSPATARSPTRSTRRPTTSTRPSTRSTGGLDRRSTGPRAP